jgi:predicted acyltransferase (DUF342 family)
VANRRITQFPSIEATSIVDEDLVTLVKVFEIDPALRNKKLNFSGLRTYLDQFYINVGKTDPFIVGNILVSGYAVISGDLTAESNFLVSGESDFKQDVVLRQNILVGGNITATGNITANQIDVLNVNTQFLEATSGNFTIATGTTIDFASGYFDIISGTTITGDSVGIQSGTVVDLTVTRGIDAVSGYFDYLEVGNAFVSGVTISGNINANNINATGTISGSTITGDVVNVAELNVTSGIFSSISGTAITGDIILFTLATGNTVNAVSGNFQNLSGATITGQNLEVTSGNLQDLVVANGITSDTLTSNFISGVSGEFQNISGDTITGTTINAGIVNVHTLNAVELEFSGDQQISGDLTVLQNIYVASGAYIGGPLVTTGIISGETITGQSGTFDTIVTAPTFSGGFATFTGLVVSSNGDIGGNLNVTGNSEIGGKLTVTGNTTSIGNTSISGNLVVDGTAEISGDTSISGNLSITSGDITGDGNTQLSGIDNILFNSGYLNNGLIISGDLVVSGSATFDELNIVSGLIVSGDLLVSGNLVVDDDIVATGNVTAVTGIFDTVTGTTANFTSGNFQRLNVTDGYFSLVSGITITGTTVNATNGNFINLSGTTITGITIETSTGHFKTLLVDDQIVIDADLSVSGNAFVTSGAYIGGNVEVTGTVTSHNNLIVLSGQAEFPWGTEAAPGITFTGDLNTGFYNPSGEMIAATVNGSRGWTIESGTGDSEGRHVLTIWGV